MIHPQWSYDAVLYEMNIRQLTEAGTLDAARKTLPFLHDLGIDIIWLMPIFPIGEQDRKGSLGSYYSIRDYCAVNPEFGELADFEKFLSDAHSLGMRVILDWVANHTSRDAVWLSQKPADWYERDEQGEALVPFDWDDTAKLNYFNRDVWQGQLDAMTYWLERGVDGFRCDMAMLMPIEFWQFVSAELHRVNPDIFMLAEAEQVNLFDRAFDCCYAWELHHLMCDVAQGRRRADALRDFLYADRERYPLWSMRMSFTSNHDENSWQGSESSRFGDAMWAMRAFTFVVPTSMPLLYTGQEIGYDPSLQFFDKDHIKAEYSANETTEFYRKLTSLKHNSVALAAGERGNSWVTINNNAEDCLLILVRQSIDDRVVAIFNMSPYVIQAQYNTGIYAGEYTDAMTGERSTLESSVNEYMQPWEFRILS